MNYLMGLLGSAAFMALIACAPNSVAPPAFHYPDLLREAGVQGPVHFRVHLDSAGSPQLATLQIVSAPHPVFAHAVRNALNGWRDPHMPDRLVERSVLFVMMDTAATDSVARCRPGASDWVVCARRVKPTVVRVH